MGKNFVKAKRMLNQVNFVDVLISMQNLPHSPFIDGDHSCNHSDPELLIILNKLILKNYWLYLICLGILNIYYKYLNPKTIYVHNWSCIYQERSKQCLKC